MPGPFINTGAFATRASDNDAVGPKDELGVWRFEAGKILRYVKSGALIPRYEAVTVDETVSTAALLGNQVLQTGTISEMLFGVADQATFANLSFGWVTVFGNATARVAAGTVPGAYLAASAATGVLSGLGASNMQVGALALQSGLSAGSAVYITTL